MKILFVSQEHPHYLVDMIYKGIKNSGTSITDYPYKPALHCSIEDGSITVRNKAGTIIGKEDAIGVNYKGEQGTINIGAIEGFVIDPIDPKSRANLDIDSFDHILITALHWDTISIAKSIIKKAPDRTYFFDDEDDPFIRSIYSKVKIYFKRELFAEDKLINSFWRLPIRVRHAAWGFVDHDPRNITNYLKNLDICTCFMQNNVYPRRKLMGVPSTTGLTPPQGRFRENREYDISYLCGMTSTYRKKFAAHFEDFCKKNNLKYYILKGKMPPMKDYIEIIRNSKLSISLPGFSFDSRKYWEVPLFKTCLVSLKPPLEIEHNFEDMSSAIFFKSFSEFDQKVKHALDKNLWADIAINGNKLFERFHTPEKRAMKVLNALESS